MEASAERLIAAVPGNAGLLEEAICKAAGG